MLNRFYVNPILPAQDGDRARRFYRDVLGLDSEGNLIALNEFTG